MAAGARARVVGRACALVVAMVLSLASSAVVAAPELAGASSAFVTHAERPLVPAVTFQDERGRTVGLDAFHGRLTLVNLWATWCPPCVKELPALDALQAAFPLADLAVVAICNGCGSTPQIRAFLDGRGIRALDLYHHPEFDVMRVLGAKGLPVTLLVDAEGREIGRLVGEADWSGEAARALVRHHLEHTGR
ncbi:MAG: redoxin family protein [Ectothiorhodospiraceae bacterium]|nr:redoxin family protein [Chromatiales bacterium]MCP5154475.1 redoxin family protein [Ectothiorhodospiraceae bacterium]